MLLLTCLSVFPTTEVFICGGYNGEVILSDLWKVNLQTLQWTKLPAVMPEPAYFHCAAVTPVSPLTHTRLFVFFRVGKVQSFLMNFQLFSFFFNF